MYLCIYLSIYLYIIYTVFNNRNVLKMQLNFGQILYFISIELLI